LIVRFLVVRLLGDRISNAEVISKAAFCGVAVTILLSFFFEAYPNSC